MSAKAVLRSRLDASGVHLAHKYLPGTVLPLEMASKRTLAPGPAHRLPVSIDPPVLDPLYKEDQVLAGGPQGAGHLPVNTKPSSEPGLSFGFSLSFRLFWRPALSVVWSCLAGDGAISAALSPVWNRSGGFQHWECCKSGGLPAHSLQQMHRPDCQMEISKVWVLTVWRGGTTQQKCIHINC